MIDLEALRAFFNENGYVVARQLFSPNEVAAYRDHYMDLRARGRYEGDLVGADASSSDPLKRYPRMIHMHRWDKTTLDFLLDKRIGTILTALTGHEPYAVQSMLYFKPPGARGQALHQDNFYLQAHPGTCLAAWLALDPCDEANGCLQVVSGSQNWPILCTEKANTKASFTDITVPVPEGQEIHPVVMDAGDMMFFGGSLVHGSYPNTTTDRFRRALICHYASGEAEQLSSYSQPVMRMDGTPVDLRASEGGGLCGTWVEEDGRPVIEMVGVGPGARPVSE